MNYWFRSSRFEIEPGEDEDTNPGLYGKQLAHWLKDKLRELGYETEAFPEDWGWCVTCASKPVFLWVGCGNVELDDADEVPAAGDLVWHCFVEAESTIFSKSYWLRLFGKLDVTPITEKLDKDLSEILKSEPDIELVKEP